MNQKELRLGNLILVNEKVQEVIELPLPENCNKKNTKGVPISKKWLINFGFKNIVDKLDIRSLDLFIGDGSIGFYSNNESDYSHVYVYCETHKDADQVRIGDNLLFVHQLQNLYFTLTNQELNTK
jgi:hypothetical protein